MYRKFCVIFPNLTPPTQGLFMIQPEQFYQFYMARCPICFLHNISLIRQVVLGKKSFECFLTIYGHGGHLEFQIMTQFSLLLYIYHINAKYEISLKLAQYFHRKCHLKFFMNGCHGNQSCHAIFIKTSCM